MYCVKCGAELKPGAKFCVNCGKMIEAADTQGAAPDYGNNNAYNNGAYTYNIDLYTLAIRFFYYVTKINVPRASIQYKIDELLSMADMSNTSFGDCMRTLYNPNINNIDITTSIKELNEEYELGNFIPGEVRKLVKKGKR